MSISTCVSSRAALRWSCLALPFVLLWPTVGSCDEREHAQLRQMQIQLQRLSQDNQSLQREKSDLAAKAAEADKLKSELSAATREIAHLKSRQSTSDKEFETAKADLEKAREDLAKSGAEIERLTAEVRKREQEQESAAQSAAKALKDRDTRIQSTEARLTAQTGRAESCERKHGGLLELSNEAVNLYEHERLRFSCDPFTGIGKISAEKKIQDLRDRMFELRLDVPPPETAAK